MESSLIRNDCRRPSEKKVYQTRNFKLIPTPPHPSKCHSKSSKHPQRIYNNNTSFVDAKFTRILVKAYNDAANRINIHIYVYIYSVRVEKLFQPLNIGIAYNIKYRSVYRLFPNPTRISFV